MMAESGGMAQDPSAREAGAELSRQDVELLVLLADGLPLDAVARRVNASERTVRRRVRAICDRLGLSSTIQVVAWAARQGLV
ncbi:MAG TPA: LuxR C-terminal-related transcriptional regulator [Trebonia sp.]